MFCWSTAYNPHEILDSANIWQFRFIDYFIISALNICVCVEPGDGVSWARNCTNHTNDLLCNDLSYMTSTIYVPIVFLIWLQTHKAQSRKNYVHPLHKRVLVSSWASCESTINVSASLTDFLQKSWHQGLTKLIVSDDTGCGLLLNIKARRASV